MDESVRIKEIEDYLVKLGELANMVYKKLSTVESNVNQLNSNALSLKKEVGDLKSERIGPKEYEEYVILKEEYEEFVTHFIERLEGLLSETPLEGMSEYLARIDVVSEKGSEKPVPSTLKTVQENMDIDQEHVRKESDIPSRHPRTKRARYI